MHKRWRSAHRRRSQKLAITLTQRPTAINDSGQIVGSSEKADFFDFIDEMTGKAYSSEPDFLEVDRGFNPEDHAFLYSNGHNVKTSDGWIRIP